MDKTIELGTKPIAQLLLKYSLPGVVAMLVNAIYNIVDRIFIGQFAGEDALAGLTVSFPFMMLIFAFAGLIGAGGSALISIRLGEKDKRGADHVFTNVLVLSLLAGIIIFVLGNLNLNTLLKLFGADEVVLPFAAGYMRIVLVGMIFQFVAFALSNIVRTEGRPNLSMTAMIVSALTNVVLDYVFIGLFGWGVQGAAAATVIGQFLGFAILASYYLRGKAVLKVHRKDLMPDLKVVGTIFGVGASTFFGTLGTSAAMAFLNTALQQYGGNQAITAMGAINSLTTIFIMPVLGMQQGLQPIIGYNHGAGEHGRTRKAIGLAILVATLFSVVVFVLLELFPSPFIQLFINAQSPTMPVAIYGLRLTIALLPVVSINILGTAYFQSVANAKVAIFLGMSRQFVYLIPAVLILPKLLGLDGAWITTPLADGLAVITTLIFLVPVLRNKPRKEYAVK